MFSYTVVTEAAFNLHQRAEKSLEIISDVRKKDISRCTGNVSLGPIRSIVNSDLSTCAMHRRW